MVESKDLGLQVDLLRRNNWQCNARDEIKAAVRITTSTATLTSFMREGAIPLGEMVASLDISRSPIAATRVEWVLTK